MIAILLGSIGNAIATYLSNGSQDLKTSLLLGLSAVAIRETGKHWVPQKSKATVATSVVLMLALFTGCASWEKNSYRSIATTATLVDATMNAWGDYVRAGMAKPEDEVVVKKAYQRYQQAMAAAKVAVAVGRAAKDSQAESAAGKAIDGVASAASEIVALIRVFTAKGANQ